MSSATTAPPPPTVTDQEPEPVRGPAGVKEQVSGYRTAFPDLQLTADEIVAAFVAKYGEKVLMAPKPEGFNLAGYAVPGALILLVGGAMFLILQRRTRMRLAATSSPPAPAEAPSPPVASAVGATPDELERLNQELKELVG